MKRTFKRILCMVTVIVLVAALLPTAALAAFYIPIYSEIYDNDKAREEDLLMQGDYTPDPVVIEDEPVELNVKDFEKFIEQDGKIYKILGINDFESYNPQTKLTIPAPPAATDPSFADWYNQWNSIYLAYGPHTHKSEDWVTTKTNHWQICDECYVQFNMNWHWDRNEDSVCDDCGDPIHYYTITIKEMEGGTVTVSKDKAKLNDTILVTVTPAAGYKLKEVRFYNLNEVHSQLTRYEDVPGSEYHFVVLPWDIEIEADFVPAE